VQLLPIWAPAARRVRAEIDGATHNLQPSGDGWWVSTVDSQPAADYAYLIDDDDTPVPDPRSRRQPRGVHGPSQLYDHGAYGWADSAWAGRPLAGSVIYELHIGTFTPGGTFDAAIERLDYLVSLGIDLVEVMPVNAFDGTHGWGYDGVLWYAVHEPYGGPDGFKRFVDAAHARGLGVVLDVVYNHLGPSGANLDRFGPYFADQHLTPWGPGLNLDGPGSEVVRRYVIDNAVSWLVDFHLDGLRLDAVHALVDSSPVHILEELASEVDSLANRLGRPLSLIAESDLNDPRLITPRKAGGLGLTAQWNDDLHHALHAAVSGERHGYYADFGSMECLATTLSEAFFHAGTWSSFRGRVHGHRVDRRTTPGHRFVAYTCDHDQIGNRAAGDRPSAYLSPGLLAVSAALVLTSPFTPMLFMGEEWGASTPWQFFSSFDDPDLAEAVRTGRRAEFADHGWGGAEVPDPQDPATRDRSVLHWSELEQDAHAWLLTIYRDLIALRRARPELSDPRLDRLRVDFDEAGRWLVLHRGELRVVANLSDCEITTGISGRLLYASEKPTGGTSTMDGYRVAAESFAVIDTQG
jgi:maltooligosyltrehalose trehalohydrolase